MPVVDAHEFTELIRQHDPAVRKMVTGMLVDRNAVDDVLQNAYINAYKAMPTFKQNSSFKTWLFRIAYNAAIDELRKVKHQAGVALDEDEPAVDRSADEIVADQVDISAALAQLNQAQRTAAVLIDGHGYGYKYVAGLLDLPVGTVASHLHEARKILRLKLGLLERGPQQ